MSRRVYIAGPMTGLHLWNFPAFDEAKKFLDTMGYEPVSPADNDRKNGMDEFHPPDKSNAVLKDLIIWDLTAVADSWGIYLLKGWMRSPGARLEHDLARFLDKKVFIQGEFEPPLHG